MDTKKSSNKVANNNSTGNQPEFKNNGIEAEEEKKKVQADQKVAEARDERISKYASSHNVASRNSGSEEVQLEESYLALEDVEAAIQEKTDSLNQKGRFAISGSQRRMSGFQKTKTRNGIRNLKKSRTIIKRNISRLEKSLTSSFRRDTNRIVRSNVRNSAKKESYHNRYSGNIKTAITKLVKGFSSEDLKALKANVAKSDPKKSDAFLMQALLKAPRHLLTKVAANSDARKIYMQHFRNELKVGK